MKPGNLPEMAWCQDLQLQERGWMIRRGEMGGAAPKPAFFEDLSFWRGPLF